MIQSMTGFGKASLQLPFKKITVEIKSLNSKGLDLNLRVPSVYREVELELRNMISTRLERGKIDFAIYIETNVEQTLSKINVPILKAYMDQLREVHKEANEIELMKMAINLPDILKSQREEIDENEWIEVQQVVKEALDAINTFRKDEGASLEKEFTIRIKNIRQYMEDALALDADRVQAIKNRLSIAISELNVTVDQNRFEQELIYYLEKLDITEEKVRLTNHLDYFLTTALDLDANGRKLGFITQEMGREINTMGSKANHAQMQKLVVLMKDELEKIKEQVLNVL